MRFTEILAASAVVAPLVAAHGDHGVPGAPKIFGLGPGVKRSDFLGSSRAARRAALPPKGHQFNKRQGGVDGRCGPEAGGASCDAGYCCSSAGWCGNTEEYCQAPDCLIDFGPACDGNKVPNGATTRNIARPQLGSIAYGGEGVYPCTQPGTVAITYDDGPYVYTSGVLDQFKAAGAKGTFFITGNNIGKGAIDDASTAWPAVIQRMVAEGHQVASHTWSHQDLSAITKEQRINQMVYNEMAIRNIIQKFPTYMRPPYSSCTAASGCQSDLADLGYVVTYFDLDTDDYNNVTPDKIQNAKDNFFNKVNPGTSASKYLAIAHDIHQQTAQNLTSYMLDLIKQKGYKAVTVGECLGDPEANWYRSSSGSIVTSQSSTPSATKAASSTASSAPTATPTAVSPDGTCGGSTGYSCVGFSEGSCCSQYGYCGSTTDHCGTGCQSIFGTCGSSSSPISSSTSSAPTSTPSNIVTSKDGSCAGNSGYTCVGFADGECCSQYGWCGKSTDHCSTGCNPLYGNCGTVSSSSVSAPISSTPAASSPVRSEAVSSTTAKPDVSSSTSSEAVRSSSANPGASSSSLSEAASSPSATPDHPTTTPYPGSSTPVSHDVISSTDVSSPSSSSYHDASSTSSSPTITSQPSSSAPADYSSDASSHATPPSSETTPAPSTIATYVRPSSSSTKCTTSAPAPTSNVSTNGKCGGEQGMTCKGYTGKFGREEGCCRWDGKCGSGTFACGYGCQKKYGKCWW